VVPLSGLVEASLKWVLLEYLMLSCVAYDLLSLLVIDLDFLEMCVVSLLWWGWRPFGKVTHLEACFEWVRLHFEVVEAELLPELLRLVLV
jgi:hypothetical protein